VSFWQERQNIKKHIPLFGNAKNAVLSGITTASDAPFARLSKK